MVSPEVLTNSIFSKRPFAGATIPTSLDGVGGSCNPNANYGCLEDVNLPIASAEPSFVPLLLTIMQTELVRHRV